jgi:hypothetical protein
LYLALSHILLHIAEAYLSPPYLPQKSLAILLAFEIARILLLPGPATVLNGHFFYPTIKISATNEYCM